jgi:hypothetical protein
VYQVWLKRTLENKLFKWWKIFLSLPNCPHEFGEMSLWCAKRIVIFYEKQFISSSSVYQ